MASAVCVPWPISLRFIASITVPSAPILIQPLRLDLARLDRQRVDRAEAIARRQHAPADDQRAGRAEAADEQRAPLHAQRRRAALRIAARKRG